MSQASLQYVFHAILTKEVTCEFADAMLAEKVTCNVSRERHMIVCIRALKGIQIVYK